MSTAAVRHGFAHPVRKWVGLALAAVVAGAGAIVGVQQGQPVQHVIFYTVATLALVVWAWNAFAYPQGGPAADAAHETAPLGARAAWKAFLLRNRGLIIALALLLLAFIVASLTAEGFFNGWNVLALAVIVLLLVVSVKVSRFFEANRSAFVGLMVLVALFAIGSFIVPGFASTTNLKAMLLFAAFLGLACVGQTLVALLGALDLSIPFVIGAANVGLLYLMGLGVPSWLAVIFILVLGTLIGLVNGILSFRLQGQALILTLGIGFAVSGLVQILTSIGSQYMGNVFGQVPGWLRNLAAMNGHTFGLPLPPVILIWIALAVLLIVGMRRTVYGRFLYALGGNRAAASRQMISERRYWWLAFSISGGVSAMAGCLLLGWSGGGFIGVGQPYLFMTLAAVVVGGTSLLGGYGGYGFTVIGVLVLQVLTSLLIGIGLQLEWQQFVIGLLILPMVALYARSPHIRTQV